MSKLQNLQKHFMGNSAAKTVEPVAPVAVSKLPPVFLEIPIISRVSPGKYDMRVLRVDVTSLPAGGEVVERGQGLGVIKAALTVRMRKSADKYLAEVLK